MNNRFSILIISVFLLVGCSQPPLKKPINRSYQELTLGMSEDKFKDSMIYYEEGKPQGTDISINNYTVYSKFYNIYLANGKAKMPELENIFEVNARFFENKLMVIIIEYLNPYSPSWDIFISKTKETYGQGKNISDGIEWDDGKTILSITKEYGEQFRFPGSTFIDSGEHYIVEYIDTELMMRKYKKAKTNSPIF